MIQSLQKRERENDPIKVGLVGAGAMGMGIAHQINMTPGMEMVWIADLCLETAKKEIDEESEDELAGTCELAGAQSVSIWSHVASQRSFHILFAPEEEDEEDNEQAVDEDAIEEVDEGDDEQDDEDPFPNGIYRQQCNKKYLHISSATSQTKKMQEKRSTRHGGP